MAPSGRTASQDSTDSLRKRVCKACDRCRLKKSKCDGSSPCSRCKADNSICVFGERKKSHDKVYPKGYVEMLEQQQSQLVAGLQETYRRLRVVQAWPGAPLPETDGHALTHDILARLNILRKGDDMFEEDPERLQQRLVSQGAHYMPRRGSVSSESEHGHPQSHSRSISYTPVASPPRPQFRESFAFETAASSPQVQSPVMHNPQRHSSHSSHRPSPLHTQPHVQDNTLDEGSLFSSWSEPGTYGDNTQETLRPQFNLQMPPIMQAAMLENNMQGSYPNWATFDNQMQFDAAMVNTFGMQTPTVQSTNFVDWQNEAMDVDFSKFVQVAT